MRSRKQSGFSSFGAVALVLCVLLLGGCGGSSGAAAPKPTATATPLAPTPAAGFALYKRPDGVYAVEYPTSWTSTPSNKSPVVNGVSFISPDKKAFFFLLPLSESVATDDYAVFLDEFAASLKATNVSPSSAIAAPSPSFTTIGARTWNELDGTMTIAGTAYSMNQYGVDHDGKTVLVVAIAPAASMSQTFGGNFKPMLVSLTFFK